MNRLWKKISAFLRPPSNRLGLSVWTKAEEFGATRAAYPTDVASAARSATSQYGVDVALEMSGSPAAFETGAPLLRIGGVYVLVGGVFPAPPVALQIEDVIRRLLTIRGVHNYTPEDLRTALAFLSENHRLPFDSLVADWLPLAEANEAFRRAKDPAVFRIGIKNPTSRGDWGRISER